MHEYYQKNYAKLKKSMNGYLKLVSAELQQASGKDYSELLEEIWDFWKTVLVRRTLGTFAYIPIAAIFALIFSELSICIWNG